MGGWGSGQWQTGRATTGDFLALDIRRLSRAGYLAPGQWLTLRWSRAGEEIASIQIRTNSDTVTLNYRTRDGGESWQQMEYLVQITATPCHLGGKRPWFICPAVGCGRRVAVLYGGKVFACRHCHRLAYACQRETADARATRRAGKIRERLDWEPGILNGDGSKPKGMHWATFDRLAEAHENFVEVSLAGALRKFGAFLPRT